MAIHVGSIVAIVSGLNGGRVGTGVGKLIACGVNTASGMSRVGTGVGIQEVHDGCHGIGVGVGLAVQTWRWFVNGPSTQDWVVIS